MQIEMYFEQLFTLGVCNNILFIFLIVIFIYLLY